MVVCVVFHPLLPPQDKGKDFQNYIKMSRGADKEPCPYRIVDDAGNAFLFGTRPVIYHTSDIN